jgi:hypothetical protein
MQITGKRVFTAVMLVGTGITTYQLFSRPQPIAAPQTREDARLSVESFDRKLEQVEVPRDAAASPLEVRFTSDEVSAELSQAAMTSAATSNPGATPPNPNPNDAVQVKSSQVKLEGDVVRGQFLTHIAGQDLYVTLAGHLGSRDGYVTFDPTEFKIGEFTVPITLVNSALQKKLTEQREQLKLPPGLASLRVENGELVIVQK